MHEEVLEIMGRRCEVRLMPHGKSQAALKRRVPVIRQEQPWLQQGSRDAIVHPIAMCGINRGRRVGAVPQLDFIGVLLVYVDNINDKMKITNARRNCLCPGSFINLSAY